MKRIEVDKDIIEEIDIEEKKVRRKKIIKRVILITVPILLFILIMFVSLRYIGNYGIVVREKAIKSVKINDDLNGLRVVHFSDIYYGEYTEKKQIDRMVSKINYTKPDIVIYTGDLISKEYILSHEEEEYLIDKLSQIDASIIKIAIRGEKDEGTFEGIMNNSGFEVLEENKLEKIYVKGSYINIINYEKNMEENNTYDDEILNIVLTHNPDNIDKILNYYNPDLIFAGHTLNGQVRLPLIGGLFRNSKYMDPYYEINNTKIFISGGIGNKTLNIRLFNNPSINFIRLRKETNN